MACICNPDTGVVCLDHFYSMKGPFMTDKEMIERRALTSSEMRALHVDNGVCSMSVPDRMCISCRDVHEMETILAREETESDKAISYSLER
jgi:hypothetical protein